VLLVVAGGSYYGYRQHKINKNYQGVRQAVFLTNGQVYFGHLSGPKDQVVVLKDIYYLKTQNALQSGTNPDATKLSLIKLGEELQGPEDIMYINRDQILFYEDMKESSKINDAIKKYVDGQATGASPAN
jgi:hypothetical protein